MDSASSQRSFGRQVQPIVGREREQATLSRALDEMLDGQGSVVLISGEAGIGKTTLVEWLAGGREQGRLVLRGAAATISRVTPPYGPWLELFQRYRPDEGLPQLPAYLDDAAVLAAGRQPGRVVHAHGGIFRRTG